MPFRPGLRSGGTVPAGTVPGAPGAQVEAMRLWCLGRDDLRSATLISLLAYAGPRRQHRYSPSQLHPQPPRS